MAFISALSNIDTVKNIKDAFGVPDITTPEMQEAIQLWFSMYFNAPANGDCAIDPAQSIPYVVVDGLYKAAFGEYEYSADESNKDIKQAVEALNRCKKGVFQKTLIGGAGYLKPIPYRNSFIFSFIPRTAYIVFARDIAGNDTSIGTSDCFAEGKYFYTLCEKRTVDENGFLTIQNALFRSDARGILGTNIPLSSVKKYAGLESSVTFSVPIWNLGLVPVKCPMENCVDGSDDGVSVYAAAAGEILNVYKHAKRTDNEYELTEPHMAVSEDVFHKDEKGNLVGVPKYIQALDDMPDNVGITVYNPTPHQEELEERENQLLRHIENICGLRRGILSHVESEDKTATEVLTSSGRYALTVEDFQGMWNDAYEESLRLIGVLGSIYYGWPSAPPESLITWGNGVLYDEDKEYARLKGAADSGYLKEEYVPAWLYDEPLETPEDFARVRKKYMPARTGGIFGNNRYSAGEDE